jgi:putative inorganic carbon (hco3(-)) transporter
MIATTTDRQPLISLLALSKVDHVWSSVLSNSRLIAICRRIIEKLRFHTIKIAPWSASLSAPAEFLSFLTALVLLAALPLPQFAADKEGLAVLSVCGIALYIFSRFQASVSIQPASGSAVGMLVLGIMCTNIASTFASHYFQSSMAGLAKVMVYILSCFWFSSVIAQHPGRSKLAVSVLLASGLAAALYGLYQYRTGVEPLATWEDPTVEQKAVRIYSTLGNPNLLAGYLTSLAPLAAAFGFMAFFKRQYVLSTVPFAIALILSSAIVLTGSRGAYIALFGWLIFLLIVVSIYTFKAKHAPPKYLLLLVAALAAVALPAAAHFFPSFAQRLASIFAGSEHSSNAFRLNVWRASLRMFIDNWWLGIGPGNKTFILAYGLYMLSGFDALGTYCVPLEIAVETGIVGLLVFACLFVTLMARAHLVFAVADNDFDRWLCVGCAAALLGIMVHGLVDTVFFRPQVQFVFWLLTALIAAAYRRSFSATMLVNKVY